MHASPGQGIRPEAPPTPALAPPPRAIPANVNLGVAPKILLGLGALLLSIGVLLLPLPWFIDDAEGFWIVLVVAAVNLIAGPVLLTIGGFSFTKARSLARNGHATLAWIARVANDLDEQGVHENPNYKFVEYAYDVNGARFGGWYKENAPGPPTNARLWVIYDPARPKRHLRLWGTF